VDLHRVASIAFLGRGLGSARRVRLLDVGFGSGDVLRVIGRWARRRGIEAELVGVDLNDKSLQAARAITPPDLTIDYRVGDYPDQTGPFEFIISSQVAHHMTDKGAVALGRKKQSPRMKALFRWRGRVR
jgi:2-polyprenyl-3-methyl-5-hydroxy-6-metoxy-1,4-benzoquinol methylase